LKCSIVFKRTANKKVFHVSREESSFLLCEAIEHSFKKAVSLKKVAPDHSGFQRMEKVWRFGKAPHLV
jgi:hypothetical protein